MAETPLRVLMVEDGTAEASLLRELRLAGFVPEAVRAETEAEFRAGLAAAPDVVLCDHELPRFGALRALALLREAGSAVPLLVVSGPVGEEAAVDAVKQGAADFVRKDRLGRLGPAVREAISWRKRQEQESRLQQALRDREAQHRAQAESIPQIVWTATPDGSIDYVNQRGLDYSGSTLEALAGPGWLEKIHPDDRAHTMAQWGEVLRSGEPHDMEFRLLRSDGEYRWHITRQAPVRDAGGAVLRWFGTCTDVHGQKRDEAALRDSEERFRRMADASPVFIWIAGVDRRFAWINRSWLEFTGRSLEDAVERGWDGSVHPGDRAAALGAFRLAFEVRARYRVEYRLRRNDGEYRWVIDTGVPTFGAADEFTGYVGSAQDITERRQAEEELRRANELLSAVTDNATDAIFVKDRRGRYLLFNPAAARFVQRPASQVLGRDDAALFDADSARAVMERDQAVMAAGRSDTAEETLTAAGVTRVYQATKAPYRNAAGKVVGIIGISRDVTDRKRAEEALLLRDRAIQSISEGILITDPNLPDNPVVYVNRGFERLTGYSAGDVLGRNCRFLQGPDTDPVEIARMRDAVRSRSSCSLELRNYRKDGTPFWNALRFDPIFDSTGRATHFVGVQSDVTERRALEQQYQQSQKMEAFGQLAGGVAHYFNNLLTVINGFGEILMAEIPADDARRGPVTEIVKAGERAAALTAQLLAFSRRTIVEPRILDLNQIVDNLGEMLRRLIGADVVFATLLSPRLGRVKLDAGQVEQVVMNLAVNARDAMPRGGRLTIETRDVELSPEEAAQRPGSSPGRHVLLVVSDTGDGMDDAVISRIFEPFFTTKPAGKGTGLGLATVYGIVKAAGGHLRVHSEVGRGSVFEVLLPVALDAPVVHAAPSSPAAPRGAETLLLVEDEAAIRKLARIALAGQGYHVLEADGGAAALAAARSHPGAIDLLVTDVVMPGMGGRELADAFRAVRPETPVLYMSGHTDDELVRRGVTNATDAFLQKPYTLLALARKVRDVLDAAK